MPWRGKDRIEYDRLEAAISPALADGQRNSAAGDDWRSDGMSRRATFISTTADRETAPPPRRGVRCIIGHRRWPLAPQPIRITNHRTTNRMLHHLSAAEPRILPVPVCREQEAGPRPTPWRDPMLIHLLNMQDPVRKESVLCFLKRTKLQNRPRPLFGAVKMF